MAAPIVLTKASSEAFCLLICSEVARGKGKVAGPRQGMVSWPVLLPASKLWFAIVPHPVGSSAVCHCEEMVWASSFFAGSCKGTVSS